MNTPSPKHIYLIEALEDVTILCEDEKEKAYWIKMEKGGSEACVQFIGFHPDCLSGSNVEVDRHLGHDVVSFHEGNEYEFDRLPESFKGLVRVSSHLQ